MVLPRYRYPHFLDCTFGRCRPGRRIYHLAGAAAFLDLILLGVMIQQQVPAETAVAIALANPMQVFRTGTMMLFDPQLVMLGPAAYVILDNFGTTGYMVFALLYPTLLGTLTAWLGYVLFRRGDLI